MQLCGCYIVEPMWPHGHVMSFLPKLALKSHVTVYSTISQTTLEQKFFNPRSQALKEVSYAFPLFEGVSVVAFTCKVGDRIINGKVKEREAAKSDYTSAISQGKTAGLLAQDINASDVFTTKLGNIPSGVDVFVTITHIAELKHDAELDGIRLTIPASIAPRYGTPSSQLMTGSLKIPANKGISITVDVSMPASIPVRTIKSPTHPIATTIGHLSTETAGDPSFNKASATLTQYMGELDGDFVLQILTKTVGTPQAVMEKHVSIPGRRAIMATLVPKFFLKPARPEIIFIADRSGSMEQNIPTLKSALMVFLKSLPTGVKFNICSFGTNHSLLWLKSKSYGEDSLKEALSHVSGFGADFGGTNTLSAVKASIESRYEDLPTEIILLTDGDIWNQGEMFSYLNREVKRSKAAIRLFTVGIGNGVSSALVEGIARAGNGFSQQVANGEKMGTKIIRALKAALTPHVTDYTFEVTCRTSENVDSTAVEKVAQSLHLNLKIDDSTSQPAPKVISLFDETNSSDGSTEVHTSNGSVLDKYAHLPAFETQTLLQAPHSIPPLYPHSRTNVYLLISGHEELTPISLKLKATSAQGQLELEIPIQVIAEPGQTIHQLGAKKAIQELEEGHGWLYEAKDGKGKLVREVYPGRFEEIVERETVRLGVEYQVAGKFTSFVALESSSSSHSSNKLQDLDEWEMVSIGTEQNESFKDEPLDAVGCAKPAGRAAGRLFRGSPAHGSALMSTTNMKRRDINNSGGFGNRQHPELQRNQPRELSAIAQPASASATTTVQKTPPFGFGQPSRAARASTPTTVAKTASALFGAPGEVSVSGALLDQYRNEMQEAAQMPLSSFESDDEAMDVCGNEYDLVNLLIARQSFTGSWKLNSVTWIAIGFDHSKAEREFSSWDEAIWTTALVVDFLEKQRPGSRDTWDLVVEKAKAWLEDTLSPQALEAVLHKAEEFVASTFDD